jgi:2-(1,2-epoxy-1,2-dihydrophenyl)acetyl-CoA isomerase
MASYETLLTDLSESGVFTLTMNRPKKKNAISEVMWNELDDLFKKLRHDTSVRVVVITGAGDGFCSGADLSDGGRDSRPHQLAAMRSISDIVMSLHGLPQPTIAKVNGVAAGAGCNMALACDLIVASDRARFSEIFAKRGLSVDFGGSWSLPRLIGIHKAKELAFFADIIDAAEAERFGLVNRVVPADELEEFVSEWASRLCQSAPIALAQTKSLLNRSIGPSMSDALDAEGAAQTVNFATEDTVEALLAFREKRDPEFFGR